MTVSSWGRTPPRLVVQAYFSDPVWPGKMSVVGEVCRDLHRRVQLRTCRSLVVKRADGWFSSLLLPCSQSNRLRQEQAPQFVRVRSLRKCVSKCFFNIGPGSRSDDIYSKGGLSLG